MYKIIGNTLIIWHKNEYFCEILILIMRKSLHFMTLLLLLPFLAVAQSHMQDTACAHKTGIFNLYPGSSPKYEYRAVWVTVIENLDWPRTPARDSKGFERQRAELVAMLDSLKAMHVNTVLLQTRVRGDVIYPSAIEPFSYLFTGTTGKAPDYDPLAFAIEECHKRGMQLHAWIVTLPLGKDNHVHRQGKHSLPHRQRALCTHYKGQWYMEPGNPATAEYIVRLVKEVVANYNVDGLHLDYVRYPDRTVGYPDAALYRKHGKGLTLADWRRKNITTIADAVYRCVKEIKPWVRVSCAPLGKFDDLARYSSLGWNAYDAVFQDAQGWMRDGIMDILFPMLYFKGNNFYPFVLDWQENSGGRHIVPGIGTYRLMPEYGGWPALELERQMHTSRSAGTAGTAMFRADHTLGCGRDAFSRVYTKRALVPPMWWGKGAAPASPQVVLDLRNDSVVTVTWKPVKGVDGEPAIRYNLYGSLGDSVDTGDIDNLLVASLADTLFTWRCRTSRALTLAVTAVDAYGRESVPATVTSGSDDGLAVEELVLPEQALWGSRIEVTDIYGRRIYKGRYSKRIGVRGLQGGQYILRIFDRHGALTYTRRFKVK